MSERSFLVRVNLTETSICDLQWILELFEHHQAEQLSADKHLRDAFDNAFGLLGECEVGLREVL